jgi:two-component system, OmpR family, sensor histidine kinase KdpD
MARGHHKIFLGMAAGVGKTYRMLQEGQAEAEAGRDVVIGYLEAHERPETIAQSAGLERVPRRGFTYRGNRIEEMNLPGVLERAPELALIDELAHTNAPGGEHAKRYEDVEDVLAAGIDVYSTVNVQHLESLNDVVCEMTGVRVRETIPDGLLAAADEVVLVDITPQSLIERLQAGKVYKSGAIQSALDNFFKIENLSALREVALRQVAEEVEAKRIPSGGVESRLGSDRLFETTVPQQIGERLLALITPQPRAQRIVRRAWRSAQRLGAELDILWVQSRDPNEEEQDQIEALRRLASVLGAHLLLEPGDDVALVTQRVVRERGITYVLMGTPRERGAISRLLRPALPQRLLRALPGIDLRIVADRTRAPDRSGAQRQLERPQEPRLLPERTNADSPGEIMQSIDGRPQGKAASDPPREAGR